MLVMQQKMDNTFEDTSPTGCAGFPSTIQSYNISGLVITKSRQESVCMRVCGICMYSCVWTCVICTHVGVVYAYVFVCVHMCVVYSCV